MKKYWTQWFEIPVLEMNRAVKFYETIFEIKIETVDLGGLKMGMFPAAETGCALCLHKEYVPSEAGVLVYFDAAPDLNGTLNNIESAGGRILKKKTQISPTHGYMALFTDTEGNRLGLYSKY